MLKIIAINSKYIHTLLSPYYLKANCEYDNINIIQTNTKVAAKDIAEMALAGDPIAIAFPCYIFNINSVMEACSLIKSKAPSMKIILGGPEVSYEYEGKYACADYIIVGEGEKAFDKLVRNIVDEIESPRIVIGEPIDASLIKSPYTDDYLRDVNGKIAYFESSRGCPYNCAYCMSGDAKLQYFDFNRTKIDLLRLKSCGIRVLKFVDRTFNANRRRCNDLLKFIVEHSDEWDFGFHFEIAADLIDDEFVDIVASSKKGLLQFEIGVQSFNETTLQAVVRKTDIEKVMRNIKRVADTGKSHVHTDLIAGLPYEDLVSFRKGFNTLFELRSDMLQLGFLKVLKGSRLKEMLGDGYIYDANPPYEIKRTPYLDEQEIAELKIVEEAVDKYHNSGLFNITLKKFDSCYEGDYYKFYYELGVFKECNGDLFARHENLLNFLVQSGVEKSFAKALLTLDYITTNSSRILPPILKSEYDPLFAKTLRLMGIDKKKFYALKIDINPNTYEKEKCLVYMDYSDNQRVLKHMRMPK